MKLGAHTAVPHDKPPPEALAMPKELGLESAERYAARTLVEASGRSR